MTQTLLKLLPGAAKRKIEACWTSGELVLSTALLEGTEILEYEVLDYR
jgi:hypothetical protein